MNRCAFKILLALILMSLCVFQVQAQHRLTILHTNDVHAQFQPVQGRGGWSHVAAYVQSVRAQDDPVLLLDAGDMTQGTPVSSIFNGTPVFEVMNAVGYDAAVLGNHEFDAGHDIDAFKEIARFPILSANWRRNGAWVADAPYRLFAFEGLNVGIIGLTTISAVHRQDLEYIDPVSALSECLPTVQEQADLIVVLSHLGHATDLDLARAVEGIDVIVGGHSHTPLKNPARVGRTLIVQAGDRGRHVGHLSLTVDIKTNRAIEYDYELVPVPMEGLEPVLQVQQVIDRWEAKVSEQMDVKIGQADRDWSRHELKSAIESIWGEMLQADFAYHNLGGTRSDLAQGPILVRHIWMILPFQNTLSVLTLDRDEIEHLDAVLGAEFEPALVAEDHTTFTMVTNSYMADRFAEMIEIGPADRTDQPGYREAVIKYIREHGRLPAVEPTRITSP